MTVTIYKYAGEYNRLDKTPLLSGAREITGVNIKGMFRADAPELYLEYAAELDGYNYIRIDIDANTTYYYYATFAADLGQTVRATCTRDPLMSFKPGILQTNIIADRTTKQAIEAGQVGYNAMLPDDQQKVLVNQQIQRKSVMSFAWASTFTVVTVG